MDIVDIVICVGPNDAKDIRNLVINVKQYILNINKIYLVMPTDILEKYRVYDSIVENIDENIFPFNKKYIDDLFGQPQRSGWYLQQLLKIYAPIVLTEIKDNYLILDADLKFYRQIEFIKNGKLLFNVDNASWAPYFAHMSKLSSKLHKVSNYSGITNLIPMKRHIVESLIKMVETEHNNIFWKVFLDKVDKEYYNHSGASEYEILFNFALEYHKNECEIRPVPFKNTDKFSYSLKYVYEACQV